MKFTETLCKTATGEIVRQDDKRAAFLLGVTGQDVPVKWREKVAAFMQPATDEAPETNLQDSPIVADRDPDVTHRDPGHRRRGRPPKGH